MLCRVTRAELGQEFPVEKIGGPVQVAAERHVNCTDSFAEPADHNTNLVRIILTYTLRRQMMRRSILEKLRMLFADQPDGFVQTAQMQPDDLLGSFDTACSDCIDHLLMVL